MEINILSLCLPRSGSTLQFNSFRAAIECLTLNGLEKAKSVRFVKSHPPTYTRTIKANNKVTEFYDLHRQKLNIHKGRRLLIAGMHRNLQEIIASRLRVKRWELNSKQIESAMFMYANDIAFEHKFIPDAINKGIYYHRDNYSNLHKISIRELITSRTYLLQKAFNVSEKVYISTIQSLAKDDMVTWLDEKWKLSKSAASKHQGTLRGSDFKTHDKSTGIHANHISPDQGRSEKLKLLNEIIRKEKLGYWFNKFNEKSLSLMRYNTFTL